ncbi:hypothetical protein [Desemzia sp. FAM 23991]|uniref:hypothetical protein n=1 Tax=unclassified Desemzia TaxID=2685243 RepID=UPI0038865AB9
MLSPQFKFNQTYTLVDALTYRLETSASVDYTLEGEIEGLTFNVTNGEIEGSIEENLGEDSSVLTSFGLSLIEETLESFAFGIYNGTIGVSLEIKGDETYCHIDLYKKDIETEMGTLNLTCRVTLVSKFNFPDISQEQVDFLKNVSAAAAGIFVLIVISAAAAASGPAAIGSFIALIIAGFTGFPS